MRGRRRDGCRRAERRRAAPCPAAAADGVGKTCPRTGDYFIFDNALSRMSDIGDFMSAHEAPVWINQVGLQSGDDDAKTKANDVLGALGDMSVGWAWWTYRDQTMDPLQHGIYYLAADGVTWLVKADWLELVSSDL